MNSEKMQYIIDSLPLEELLAQLAEEASELGHAALKLRRAVDGSNPTPVTVLEAVDDLREEIADVWLLIQTLGFDQGRDVEVYHEIISRKVDRWVMRLEDYHGKE